MREIKTYRKIATIQAEQFDGSAGKLAILMDKYHIIERIWSIIIREYYISTLEGPMSLNIGDWIATGVKGEHWVIADDVFKASYVEVGAGNFKQISSASLAIVLSMLVFGSEGIDEDSTLSDAIEFLSDNNGDTFAYTEETE